MKNSINVLRNRMGDNELDSSGTEQGSVVGSYEEGTEPAGSIKGGYFFIRYVIDPQDASSTMQLINLLSEFQF
jgi:hypothetical protein